MSVTPMSPAQKAAFMRLVAALLELHGTCVDLRRRMGRDPQTPEGVAWVEAIDRATALVGTIENKEGT
jgi:hypothetical protein